MFCSTQFNNIEKSVGSVKEIIVVSKGWIDGKVSPDFIEFFVVEVFKEEFFDSRIDIQELLHVTPLKEL